MRKGKRIFGGLLFLLAAVALILHGLGYLQGFGFWTVAFSIILIGILAKGLVKQRWGQSLLALAILIMMFKENLGLQDLSNWLIVGAAILGTVGLNILFPRRYRHWFVNNNKKNTVEQLEISSSEDGEKVLCEVSFGSASKYISSRELKKVKVDVAFGNLDLYLDNAVLKEHNAVIKADVAFGKMSLYLPQEWNVKLLSDSSFGSINEIGHSNPQGEETLVVKGDVAFGSIEIRYV